MAQSSRQKRKRRRRARPPEAPAPEARSGYSRARAKDEAARAALEPLAPGERPTAVTIGAVVAFLLGIANLISYVAGVEIRGDRPSIVGILAYSGLMFLVAWGMWHAKYWAVLGLETILGLIIVIFGLLIMRAGSVGELLIALAVLAASGTLFWFLIKALARIQMPERPGARRAG